MRQFAQAASLTSGLFHVVITWQDDSGRTIWTLPSINIPAASMEHAFRIADAINATEA